MDKFPHLCLVWVVLLIAACILVHIGSPAGWIVLGTFVFSLILGPLTLMLFIKN